MFVISHDVRVLGVALPLLTKQRQEAPFMVDPTLRYLEASKVQTPVCDLSAVDLRTTRDQRLGHLMGVLIDPMARRVRYFVIESLGWLGRQCCLLPADCRAQVDPQRKVLRLDVDRRLLKKLEKFKRAEVRDFGDDDLLSTMFHPRVA